MADPILNLPQLNEGDPLGYTRQNKINLVLARFAVQPTIAANNIATPPGSVAATVAYILNGAGTGLWSGHGANTVAFALVANPNSAEGWYFYTPIAGFRCWVLAGSPTGHIVWNGTTWIAV